MEQLSTATWDRLCGIQAWDLAGYSNDYDDLLELERKTMKGTLLASHFVRHFI